jgi:pyrroline-5-carboxylate reductase
VSAEHPTPLPPVLLVGGGRMGSAMLAGWREAGLAQAVVIDPQPATQALAGGGVTVVASAAGVPPGFAPAAVVLAVKPQAAAEALPACAPFASGAVALSIMAGRTIAGVAALLPGAAVVRAMPNTPAAIGQGFTAAFAGPGVSPAQRSLCDGLLGAIGEVAWLDAEPMLDAVTAVSGGGPAYVFLLAELLEAAALDQGLPPELARRMARCTVAGSGALLAAGTEEPAAMRRAVTSPAGTTERALAVLMADEAWPALMRRAIAAATARSRELSS